MERIQNDCALENVRYHRIDHLPPASICLCNRNWHDRTLHVLPIHRHLPQTASPRSPNQDHLNSQTIDPDRFLQCAYKNGLLD
ncbi:hypothetical protein D3C73_527610 [compost metagenome]